MCLELVCPLDEGTVHKCQQTNAGSFEEMAGHIWRITGGEGGLDDIVGEGDGNDGLTGGLNN